MDTKTRWSLLLIVALVVGCGSDAAPKDDAGTSDATETPLQCERVGLEEFEECNFGSFGSDRQAPIQEDVEKLCASRCNSAEAFIVEGTELEDLSFATGLTNLDGALVISENEKLQSLEGLEDVEILGFGGNVIGQNFELTNLKGLDSLVKVRDYFTIRYNSVESLEGLESLEEVEKDLVIEDNWNLTDLRALESLERIGEDLVIENNEKLPQCEIDWLVERVEVGGEVRVSNNGAETDADCS